MKRKITFMLLMLVGIASAQVTNEGKPFSWKNKGFEPVEAYRMPDFDLAKLQAQDEITDKDKGKPWRYGFEFIVDHNLQNSGNWSTLANGDRVWRIRYSSAGAQTLNFLFSDFYMPKGAKVYLYNNDRTDLLGAYDEQQNNEKRELGTWLVKGDDIWIEYYEPAAVAGQGKLEVFKVVHGYRSLSAFQKDPSDGLNTSGNCNYDVNCFMDDIDGLKDINKKSVALIIVANSAFCTGALINNTSNDGTPYFLTANHCADETINQWSFRFNWISPNPVCAGSAVSTDNAPNYYQTVSGAQLKAKRAQSDFCLLQITSTLPTEWDLVWAGWDRSETPAQSTFGIHHPAGDIMKACRDFDAPILNNDGGEFMWEVADWDLGVTQGGSSGSPLFNQDGRIVGQLYGGTSGCNGDTDNGGDDVYGRLGKSWDAGTTSSTRLKDWLDPTNTGAMTVNYYPEQPVYVVNARVSVSELGLTGCDNDVHPVIRLVNKGTQNLTSAQITYTFNNVPAVINWTGDLVVNTAIDIELPVLEGTSGENTLSVEVTMPNGQNDEDISDNLVVNSFIVTVMPITNVEFYLQTDYFAEETSWELKNEAGVVLYEGDNYSEFESFSQTFTLTTAGCYTFTIYDSEGDGMCCDYGPGFYRLETPEGTLIHLGGAFGSSETVNFRLTDVLAADDFAFKASVKIYPNPSSGIFNVVSENNLEYTLTNMLGQTIKKGSLNQTGNVDISSNTAGVYMLNVRETATGKTANYKLIKQ
ncbi:T9SS type A sorting domain-containing protein [Flavobacterium suzhouense]|uniref:T9SS type A sorting domain-containing protein n=1 Tax=Flavobacterium suzhouense TaxID=1529638 RepID=A0ABW5NQ02_9FLAO